ncbi:MAG: PaaI family thioesterase [Vicinamibacterales bacterium]
MAALGARLVSVEPGAVAIDLPFSPALTQQHGYFHAAATTAIADTAGGYAALTLMAPGDEVLAVEFKVNLLRPAVGDRLVATAQVLKPGRTLTVCRIDVHAHRDGAATLVATMTQTNFRVPGGGGA